MSGGDLTWLHAHVGKVMDTPDTGRLVQILSDMPDEAVPALTRSLRLGTRGTSTEQRFRILRYYQRVGEPKTPWTAADEEEIDPEVTLVDLGDAPENLPYPLPPIPSRPTPPWTERAAAPWWLASVPTPRTAGSLEEAPRVSRRGGAPPGFPPSAQAVDAPLHDTPWPTPNNASPYLMPYPPAIYPWTPCPGYLPPLNVPIPCTFADPLIAERSDVGRVTSPVLPDVGQSSIPAYEGKHCGQGSAAVPTPAPRRPPVAITTGPKEPQNVEVEIRRQGPSELITDYLLDFLILLRDVPSSYSYREQLDLAYQNLNVECRSAFVREDFATFTQLRRAGEIVDTARATPTPPTPSSSKPPLAPYRTLSCSSAFVGEDFSTLPQLRRTGEIVDTARATPTPHTPPSSKPPLVPDRTVSCETAFPKTKPSGWLHSANLPDTSPEARRRRRSSAECWNCAKPGHAYSRCQEPRRRFCYRCGKHNVTVSTCGDCARAAQEMIGTPPSSPCRVSAETRIPATAYRTFTDAFRRSRRLPQSTYAGIP